MDTYTKISQIADKVKESRNKITTEEATKTAFVLPFLSALGYDVFDPNEVIPEFTADIGTKKGEKVDYCIVHNGQPSIIIECKDHRQKLDVHQSQLHRYFGVTTVKFAILTNGIEYRFFTDLKHTNRMDEAPFLTINLLKLRESHVAELNKFTKQNFDVESIAGTAMTLKHLNQVKRFLSVQTEEVDEDLARLLAKRFYSGRVTNRVVADFQAVSKRALGQFITEQVNDRLAAALTKEEERQEAVQMETENSKESKIITTQEELDGYNIVRSIVRKSIDISRVTYRDTQTYFSVLVDDNNRRPICRLYLNRNQKYIGLFEGKNCIKHAIESIDDLYEFADQIIDTAKTYA